MPKLAYFTLTANWVEFNRPYIGSGGMSSGSPSLLDGSGRGAAGGIIIGGTGNRGGMIGGDAAVTVGGAGITDCGISIIGLLGAHCFSFIQIHLTQNTANTAVATAELNRLIPVIGVIDLENSDILFMNEAPVDITMQRRNIPAVSDNPFSG